MNKDNSIEIHIGKFKEDEHIIITPYLFNNILIVGDIHYLERRKKCKPIYQGYWILDYKQSELDVKLKINFKVRDSIDIDKKKNCLEYYRNKIKKEITKEKLLLSQKGIIKEVKDNLKEKCEIERDKKYAIKLECIVPIITLIGKGYKTEINLIILWEDKNPTIYLCEKGERYQDPLGDELKLKKCMEIEKKENNND